MLRYFFERGEEDRAPLFDDLSNHGRPEFAAHQGRYPVVFLTFKDVKARTFEDALFGLRRVLGREVRRHLRAIPPPALADFDDGDVLERVAAMDRDPGYQRESLRALSALLHQVYGEPAVILLDEYDTPVDENIVFPELRKRPHNLWSLLFFSGYLKSLDSRVEDDALVCRLASPNLAGNTFYAAPLSGVI